jgi:transposase
MDTPQELKIQENVQMTKKARRLFTAEQKAEAVAIVKQSGHPISQVAKEMGLSESALRKWLKQAQLAEQGSPQVQLSSASVKNWSPYAVN